MPNVWWVGYGDSRLISASSWASLGFTGRPDSLWNSANGWAIDHTAFTSDQLAYMAGKNEFRTGQTGPRVGNNALGQTQNDLVGSNYAYYLATKRLYDDMVENPPEGGGDGGDNLNAILIQSAKNPDQIVVGAITLDGNDLVVSAPVLWPDGTPGTFTITSRDATTAVLAYNITYGSPVTKTFTQPTITRNSNGVATNVPAIVVS